MSSLLIYPRAPSLPNQHVDATPTETKELQRQVQELIDRGYISESMSPYSILVLLVPKKDTIIRMCVDIHAINNVTTKYEYPLPRLDDMLNESHGPNVFSRIYFKSGYHQIHIKEGD